MAYMDNSLWVAPDKNTLTQILNTTMTFYKYNNIKVNPTKSFLLTNSATQNPSIEFDNIKIKALKRNEPLKYFGAWFTLHKLPKYVQKLIMAEMLTNIKKLQLSKITEKQAIYIINRVLIPRLQYRLYSSYLKPSQLTMLTRACTNIVRNKAKLAR